MVVATPWFALGGCYEWVGGWLAGWLAGLLAGWLSGWRARWLAGWLSWLETPDQYLHVFSHGSAKYLHGFQ